MKESLIQKQILDWLRVMKIFCWKVNNVGTFNRKSGGYIPSGMCGVPDIICIINGLFIGIEVKNEKGVQSDHQKEFERNCVKNGGFYIVARSIDDVEKYFIDNNIMWEIKWEL